MMKTINCRVNPRLWWNVGACVLMSAFFGVSPFLAVADDPNVSLWAFLVICEPIVAVLSYAAIYLALSLLREEIVADEAGLRWRGAFGPWKSARWDEISDFYWQGKVTRLKSAPVQTEASRALPKVETPRGQLKLERSFTRLDELMPLIAARAVNAPTHDWEIWEFRPAQGFSRRFVYWTKARKWEAIWISADVGFLWIVALWAVIFSPKNSHSAEDWKWMWFPVLMMVALFGSLGIGALFGVWSAWRDRNFCWKHRAESVEISLRGLLWTDGKQEIRADWSQVHAVTWVAGRGPRGHYRVQIAQSEFPVWVVLENVVAWVSLMRYFAPQLRFLTPYETQRAHFGTRWSGSREGEGARIFGFRGYELRTFLLLPLVLSWMPLVVRQTGTPDDSAPLPLIVALGCALVGTVAALYGVWCERSAAIWADENGLETHFPLLRVRRIAWSEIEAMGRDERGAFLRVGGEKSRLLWGMEPRGWDELKELIAQRAASATGATGKWD